MHSPVELRALGSAIMATLHAKDGNAGIARARATVAGEFESSAVALTDSGTSALTLALGMAAEKNGVVAMPAYACIDLATAAQGAGVRVALYDVEPGTLSPDWNSLQQAVDRGASAIVVVHLFGHPVDMRKLRSVARSLPIIEDAAQSACGRLDGRLLGTLGDLSVLSFGRGKGMNAAGGGALLGLSARWTAPVENIGRSLTAGAGGKALAAALAQWVLGRPSLYAIPSALPFLQLGEMIYHMPRPPRRISDASAALVPSALRLAAGGLPGRRLRAVRLLRAARDAAIKSPDAPSESEPGYLRLPVLLSRDVEVSYRLGLVKPYPVPLSAHPEMAPFLAWGGKFPGAELLAARLVTMPVHSLLEEQDLRRLELWLTSVR